MRRHRGANPRSTNARIRSLLSTVGLRMIRRRFTRVYAAFRAGGATLIPTIRKYLLCSELGVNDDRRFRPVQLFGVGAPNVIAGRAAIPLQRGIRQSERDHSRCVTPRAELRPVRPLWILHDAVDGAMSVPSVQGQGNIDKSAAIASTHGSCTPDVCRFGALDLRVCSQTCSRSLLLRLG
jgi:hypothetical protein